MTYTYIEAKDTDYIQNQFINWLNNILDDPYQQKTNNSRSDFVIGEDNIKLVTNYPKLQVSCIDNENEKITHKKTSYLEKVGHNFLLVYYNQKEHTYTFEDGAVLKNKEQSRKYLQYVKKLIKKNADKFTFAHKITFGTIASPEFNNQTRSWMSMIAMTLETYER